MSSPPSSPSPQQQDADELSAALGAMSLKQQDQEQRQEEPSTGSETPQTPTPKAVSTPPAQIYTPPAQVIKKEEQQGDGTDPQLQEFTRLFETKLKVAAETKPEDQTLVMLSPYSPEHVFSRHWVGKRYISSIVERPERVRACSLGIGAAMNEMTTKLKLETSGNKKTKLDVPHVARVHGADWASKLYELCEASNEKLLRGELEVPDDWHSGDIYLCKGTIDALEGNLAAIEQTVDKLFTTPPQQAFVNLRPPGHHSHPCTPSGFCLVNNAHIAIQYAAAKYDVSHAAVLDFDLHHGDGTQDITFELNFANDKAPKIGYFSLHDINSFPTEPGYADMDNVKNASVCLEAHDMTVWNVHLARYTTEQEFDRLYESRYSVLFTKARQFLAGKPRPFVVISAGFDASEFETQTMQRHGVRVPTKFYHRFTQQCVELAQEFNCPVISLLEGGYSDAALSTGVFAHLAGMTQSEWKWTIDQNCVREFERGCKPRFALGAAGSWVTEGVLLGRALWGGSLIGGAAAGLAMGTVTKSKLMTPLLHTTGKPVSNNTNVNFDSLDALATPSRVLRDRAQLKGKR